MHKPTEKGLELTSQGVGLNEPFRGKKPSAGFFFRGVLPGLIPESQLLYFFGKAQSVGFGFETKRTVAMFEASLLQITPPSESWTNG